MILLVGANGYVGSYFQLFFEQKNLIWRPFDWRLFLSANRSNLISQLRASKATFLINCAGYTGKPNVDVCELNKTECFNGNVVLTRRIREVCESINLGWGHVSSGCIFSGERKRGEGWQEDDVPNFTFSRPPCSFYSGTKALAEEALGWGASPRSVDNLASWKHESEPSGYVWRLRIPFDEKNNPRNYLFKLQNYDSLLEARNSLSQLREFVSACWQCVEQKVPFGIYNVTNPGSVTTSEVVGMIQKLGVSQKSFSFFDSEEAFMKEVAKTPRSNCVLDTSKLEGLGILMRPVHDAIEWSLKNWRK